MKLLDTNIIIHYLKGLEPVVARLQASSPSDLAVPSVVAYEIEYGAAKTKNPRRKAVVLRFLENLAAVPFDHAAAREAARVRAELEQRGSVIGPLDLLIAGTAISQRAVLVTYNTREFARIKGLRLEDWTK